MRRNGGWCWEFMNQHRLSSWLFGKSQQKMLHICKAGAASQQEEDSGDWQRKSSCTDIQLSGQMGAHTVMVSNFPQSYGGFLSELPGAVFTETVARQHIPNSIRICGRREQWWGERAVRCYIGCIDSGVLILLTEGHGRLLPYTRMSHFVFVYSRSHMWQHVGGWRLGVLQFAGHPGPESILTEMFAQLKHHLLRHITEGCQQQNESMESMNDRCKTTANVFILCLSSNSFASFLWASPLDHLGAITHIWLSF